MTPTKLSNIRQLKNVLLLTIVFSLFCATTQAQFNESAKAQLVKEWQRAKTYTLEYLDAMPKDQYVLR